MVPGLKPSARGGPQAADHLVECRAQAVSGWPGLDSLLERGALRVCSRDPETLSGCYMASPPPDGPAHGHRLWPGRSTLLGLTLQHVRQACLQPRGDLRRTAQAELLALPSGTHQGTRGAWGLRNTHPSWGLQPCASLLNKR